MAIPYNKLRRRFSLVVTIAGFSIFVSMQLLLSTIKPMSKKGVRDDTTNIHLNKYSGNKIFTKWIIKPTPMMATADDWKVVSVSTQFPNKSSTDLTRTEAHLMAIKDGARFIIDIHGDVFNSTHLKEFTFSEMSTGLQYNRSGIFDPNRLHKFIKPGQYREDYFFCIGMEHAVLIQKCLMAPNPFNQLTKINQLPNFFLSSSTQFIDYSQDALFSYNAFWTLGVSTLNAESEDLTPVIRNAIVQRLLGEMVGEMMIRPMCMVEYTSNKSLYDVPPVSVLGILNDFKCGANATLQLCFLELVQGLENSKVLEKDSSVKIQQWLAELARANYVMPLRQIEVTSCSNQFPVLYNFVYPPDWNSEILIKSDHYHSMCPNVQSPWQQPIVDDVALIVTYNQDQFYFNRNLTDLMHRPYFKHLIFCGPNITTFYRFLQKSSTPSVIFLGAYRNIKDPWKFMYECTMLAMEMKLGVKGYLQVGEDVLLNSWNVRKLPLDKFWLPEGFAFINRTIKFNDWGWWWWYGRQTNAVLDNLKSLTKGPNLHDEKTFWKNFVQATGSEQLAINRPCDLFYVPDKYEKEYRHYCKVFSRGDVMHELALPSIVVGIASMADVVWLNDTTLWTTDRRHSYDFFHPDNLFIHPVKPLQVFNEQKYRSFFCDVYLKYLTNKTGSVCLHAC